MAETKTITEAKRRIKEEQVSKQEEEAVEVKEEPKLEPKEEPKKEVKPTKEEKAKPEEKKEEKKPKKAKKPEKEKILEERIITVNLGAAWRTPRTRRTRAAVKILKKEVERKCKKPAKLDMKVNEIMWARGIQKPPRRVRIKAQISEEFVRVSTT